MPPATKRNPDRSRLACVWFVLVCQCLCAPVHASQVDLRFMTLGQGYQTRTLSGDLLDRRRITQWIDLTARQLLGVSGFDLEVDFRFDVDLGLGLSDTGTDVAELFRAHLRLPRLLDCLQITLGRQMLVDEIDFVQFDGVRFDLLLGGSLTFQWLAGFQVRDRSFLGGNWLVLDGLSETSTPVLVLGAGLNFVSKPVDAALVYRRLMLVDENWPLDGEHLAATVSLRIWEHRLGLDSGASYHLALDRFDRLRLAFWWRVGSLIRLCFEAGGQYFRPTFAMDSIFNFFQPAPFWQFHLGLRLQPTRRTHIRLHYQHRSYEQDSFDDFAQANGVHLQGLFQIDRKSSFQLSASFEDGDWGRRFFLAPGTKWTLTDKVALDSRLLLISNRDEYNERLNALTMGGSLGLEMIFARNQKFFLTGEINFNPIHPIRFRVVAMVDLSFAFRSGPSVVLGGV